jgi:rubrerythrin
MRAQEVRRTPAQASFTAAGGCGEAGCPDLSYWKCRQCRLLITAATPPEFCPTCRTRCQFADVTCYSPSCGGPGNFDPRLL